MCAFMWDQSLPSAPPTYALFYVASLPSPAYKETYRRDSDLYISLEKGHLVHCVIYLLKKSIDFTQQFYEESAKLINLYSFKISLAIPAKQRCICVWGEMHVSVPETERASSTEQNLLALTITTLELQVAVIYSGRLWAVSILHPFKSHIPDIVQLTSAQFTWKTTTGH
jgi:hypothetical protein